LLFTSFLHSERVLRNIVADSQIHNILDGFFFCPLFSLEFTLPCTLLSLSMVPIASHVYLDLDSMLLDNN